MTTQVSTTALLPRVRVRFPGVVTALALLLGIGCGTATSARVSLHTDLPHTARSRVALWVGSTPPAVGTPPTTTVDGAWDSRGDLGDLVAVPPNSSAMSVVVYAALDRNGAPEGCIGAVSKTCIVAKRSFRYRANEAVRLPVGLYRQCLGITCADGATCNYVSAARAPYC